MLSFFEKLLSYISTFNDQDSGGGFRQKKKKKDSGGG